MSILLDLVKNLAIQRGVGSLEKRINQFYSDSDDNTNQLTQSNQRQGLGSILGRTAAYGFLGPILGPLAFALGSGIMSRRNQMSLMPSGDEGPSGIVSGKVQTLDGRIVDAGSDEARADMNRRDQEFQDTGDYDVYSDTVTTGPTQPAFDPSADYYTGSDEEDRDNETTTSDAPAYDFARGGLASLYR